MTAPTTETNIEIGVVAVGVFSTVTLWLLAKAKDKLYESLLVKFVPSIRKFSLTSLRNNSRVDAAISQYLAELRVVTGASRAALMEMRNGGDNAAGICFRKMSMTTEICGRSVASVKEQSQNMDVAMFPELIELLVGNESVFTLCVSALGDGEAKSLAIVRDINCGILVHRITYKRYGVINLFGFVALTFLTQQCTPETPACAIASGENVTNIQKTTALIASKLEQKV